MRRKLSLMMIGLFSLNAVATMDNGSFATVDAGEGQGMNMTEQTQIIRPDGGVIKLGPTEGQATQVIGKRI